VDLATLDIENVGTIFFGPGLTDGLKQVADVLEYKGDPVVTGTVVRNIVVGANQLQGDVTFTGSGQAAVTVTGSTVDISVPPPPPVVAVDSLNTLTGALTLTSTTNTVTITPSGNTIDLEVQQTAVVDKLNGLTGEVVLSSSDGSITITPDTLTDKINLSAVAVAPTAWANYPAINTVDLSSNPLTDSNGVVAITADAALTLGKNKINLLAQNGAFGGSIGLTAKSGTLGTNGGLIELTADGGSEPTGLFGQINIVANPGTANVLDVPVTTGGSINIQANSGGSITTATSKVVLNAGGINIYSGVGTPFGSLFGYTYINASLGISLVAGSFTSGLQQPGTVYLYGETGITLGADTYAHNIYPILGSNLVLNGRVSGEVVNINNAGTIAFNTGGALTGVATINGASYPPAAGGVTSLNSLTGGVTLAAGTDISIVPTGNTLTINATGGSAPTEITNAGGTVSCGGDGSITASQTGSVGGFNLNATGDLTLYGGATGGPVAAKLTLPTTGNIRLETNNNTAPNSQLIMAQNGSSLTLGAGQATLKYISGAVTLTAGNSLLNLYTSTDPDSFSSLEMQKANATTLGGDAGVTIRTGVTGTAPVSITGHTDVTITSSTTAAKLQVAGGAAVQAGVADLTLTNTVAGNIKAPNLAAATKPDVVYYDTTSKALSYGMPAIPTTIANAGASVACNADTTVVMSQTTTSGGMTLDATGNLLLYGGSVGNPPASNLDLQASGVINLTSGAGSDITVKSGNVAAGGTQVVVASTGTAPAVGLYVSPSALYFNGSVINTFVPFVDSYQIYVAPNGNNTTGTGSQQNPYLTIAAAITKRATISSAIEVSIILSSGTYTENFTLAQNTFLCGIPTGEQQQPCNVIGNVILSATAGQIALTGLQLTAPAAGVAVSVAGAGATYSLFNCNLTGVGSTTITFNQGTTFVTECRITSSNTPSQAIVIGSGAIVQFRNCSIASQTSNVTSIISCNGNLTMRDCSVISVNTISTVLQALLQFGGASAKTVDITNCTFSYTNTLTDTGGNKCCIQFNNSALTYTASITNCVLICEGATTGAPQIQCIQDTGAGSVVLSYGNLLAGATAHHIAPTVTKTALTPVP